MGTKTRKDPAQSLWIEDKYNKDLQTAMKTYSDGMIELMVKHADNLELLREKLDEYKSEAIETVFRPLAKKYVTLSAQQGGKFAKLQLKHAKT